MRKAAKKLLAYSREFGIARGLTAYRTNRSAQSKVTVRLTGGRDFVLRPGKSDVHVFEGVFLAREYAFDLKGVVPKVILDVGANIGATTVFFATRFPDARIIALEPEKGNFDLLQENTRDLPNVTAVQAALWSRRTQLSVTNPEADAWSYTFVDGDVAKDGEQYQAVSLRDLMDTYSFDTIDILKMDIEGGEKDLFEGDAHPWLSQTRILVIELHDRKRSGCSRAVYTQLVKLNFDQHLKGYNTIIYNHTAA